MKKIHAVVLLSLALSACQSNPEEKQIQIPQFNSLEKLQLKFSEKQQTEFSTDKLEIEDYFQSKNSDLDLELKSLNSELEEVRKNLVDTESRIAKIKDEAMQDFGVDLSDEESYQTSINELHRKQGAADSILEANSKTVTDLQQFIENNQSEIQSISANIESTKKSLTNYKALKSEEEEKVKNLKSEIKELEKTSWWDSLKFWSEGNTEELNLKQSRLETLESKLSKLDSKISFAQAEIKADEQKLKIFTDNLIRRQGELSSHLQNSGSTESPELIALRIQQLQTLEESFWENTATKERTENEILEISNLLSALEEKKAKYSTDSITYLALDHRKAKLAVSINSGETPEFSEVIEAVVLQNELADNVNFDSLTKAMEELKKISQVEAIGPHDFKVQFDSKIETEFLGGDKIKYHPEAWALQHPMSAGKIQCYGGTNLFATLNSLRNAPTDNLVFIYETGHVLPGYIVVENNEMVLKGIEMTAAGRAEINYGPTANIAGDIRVLDAKQVMLVELFRDSEFDWDSTVKSMLETVQAYGFKTEEMKSFETKVAKVDTVFSSDQLNSTFFGFGEVDAKPKPRTSIDKMDKLIYQKVPASSADKHTTGSTGYQEEIPSDQCKLASEFFFNSKLSMFYQSSHSEDSYEFKSEADAEIARNEALKSCDQAEKLISFFHREDSQSYIELAKLSSCDEITDSLFSQERRENSFSWFNQTLPFPFEEVQCISGNELVPLYEYAKF